MFQWLKNFFKQGALEDYDQPVPRERLIASSRIVMIDDEPSLLIDELRATGFAVDHDATGNDLRGIDGQIYDLAILDYHGVGARLGQAQGLDLLRHIRRVSPRTRVLAYTSRSLTAAESEFFRSSHGVLPKDHGLVESMAVIEEELQKAHSKQHLFDAMITKLNIASASVRDKALNNLVKSLKSRDESRFKEYLRTIGGAAGEKAVEIIVGKLFW